MAGERRAAFTRREAIVGAGACLSFGARAETASTLLVTHPAGLAHDMGPAHVERPERLRAVLRALDDDARFAGLMRAEAPLAAQEALLRAHSSEHLARLAKSAPADGYARIGPDVAM
ncbi:MAG: acetoin utilization protein, partial [Methylocystis sp.]